MQVDAQPQGAWAKATIGAGVGILMVCGIFWLIELFAPGQSAAEHAAEMEKNKQRWIDWCHKQKGTARVDYRGRFDGCSIPPQK